MGRYCSGPCTAVAANGQFLLCSLGGKFGSEHRCPERDADFWVRVQLVSLSDQPLLCSLGGELGPCTCHAGRIDPEGAMLDKNVAGRWCF